MDILHKLGIILESMSQEAMEFYRISQARVICELISQMRRQERQEDWAIEPTQQFWAESAGLTLSLVP